MRFDHAVIGVADLEHAVAAYRALGFVVAAGGRHTGEGTHNAIVRFGLDYLELMAVEDPAIARTRPFGAQLLDFLRDREGGLIGYVVAGRELNARALAMRKSGLEPVGPIAMQRERPDGRALRWRLLFPRGQRWRDIAPFIIEWGTSDAERVAWDAPLPHPNGVTRVDRLAVRVPDLADASALYEQVLGLAVTPDGPGRAHTALGAVTVDLIAGGEPGLAELTLAVADIARAATASQGLLRDGDGSLYRIPPGAAAGARLALTEVSGSES